MWVYVVGSFYSSLEFLNLHYNLENKAIFLSRQQIFLNVKYSVGLVISHLQVISRALKLFLPFASLCLLANI